MKMTIQGRLDEAEKYTRACRAMAEHYDDLVSIRTSFDDPRQKKGKGFSKSDLLGARPTSDWNFVVEFADDQFAIWFQMKYL